MIAKSSNFQDWVGASDTEGAKGSIYLHIVPQPESGWSEVAPCVWIGMESWSRSQPATELFIPQGTFAVTFFDTRTGTNVGNSIQDFMLVVEEVLRDLELQSYGDGSLNISIDQVSSPAVNEPDATALGDYVLVVVNINFGIDGP